jgi:hypothetical protein
MLWLLAGGLVAIGAAFFLSTAVWKWSALGIMSTAALASMCRLRRTPTKRLYGDDRELYGDSGLADRREMTRGGVGRTRRFF